LKPERVFFSFVRFSVEAIGLLFHAGGIGVSAGLDA
jgi:hypothetical protein